MDEKNIIEDTRGKLDIEETEKIVEERKKKLIDFFKNKQIWVIGILIIALILGGYIRYLPMTDHGGNPGLWDITTNTWTLGPDLDPWLFTRYAKTIVEQGQLPEIDTMRNVPLGFKTSKETQLLSYMIVGTYYLVNLFGDYNILFAAAFFPVIMFALTIISFFLFVREIFNRKTKESVKKANIIASISTFIMIVTPVFLSRTIAGIPEKESAAFFFMFLAFYLFLKAWKSEGIRKAIILSILSGIATALMGLIWGGFIYVFITIAIATIISFIFNTVDKQRFIVYFLWFSSSFIILISSSKFTFINKINSLESLLAASVFFILLVHFIIWKIKIFKGLEKIKLPKNIVSLIVGIVLILILGLVAFGPSFIIEKINVVNKMFFTPTVGRWAITVAENRQPYFTEWEGNFGPHIKDFAIMFWLFFAGSIVLFKEMLGKLKNKDSWILTGFYTLLLFGLVFSRYSGSSIFNGENFISKAFYYGSALLLIGSLIYYYTKYHKLEDYAFEKIDYEFLFLFAFFFLCLFTARGAVRLIMVLATVAPVFLAYLVVKSIEKFRETKDETWKIMMGALMIIIIIASLIVFFGIPGYQSGFFQQVKSEAYNMVPSSYNQQWQKAMAWVREETPKDAVFGHWWDYGYWVQSIGDRATVTDGGNAISFWNYYMGRLVLTGDNQKDALEFLYNHNTNYFLIDSSDIGKYGAFSSIGSNENYDRYSWIGAFLLDESQTQETNNQTLFIYPGGVALDEDLIIEEEGKEIMLPSGNSGVGAIILPSKNSEEGNKFEQPYIIVVSQGKQYKVNLRYLYADGEFFDFTSGIEATAYIFPRLVQQGQGITKSPIGAAMYLSPRLMRGMLSQIYILNDPFNKFPNFKIIHKEQNSIIDDLNRQGMNLSDFVYFQGVQGPIKIWEIKYTGDEKIRADYTDNDASKYLTWEL